MPARFDYHAPESIPELIALIDAKGAGACLMAGGTDVMVRVRQGHIQPTDIVSIKKIPGLDLISASPQNGLFIGALALLADVAADPDVARYFPAVAEAAQSTANVQVRNMGTLVGNLCNASPSADNAPALLALGAEVVIVGKAGERRLALSDFFKGPGQTDLDPPELVTAVTARPLAAGSGLAYKHLSARGAMDCAAVNVAALVTVADGLCRHAAIAVGACAPTPIRAPAAEALLAGKPLSDGLLDEAAHSASGEALPISDVRASAGYRRQMVQVLVRRTLAAARTRAGEGQ
jgi:CO/xanthine dehydrogenase FAD-binding subunit